MSPDDLPLPMTAPEPVPAELAPLLAHVAARAPEAGAGRPDPLVRTRLLTKLAASRAEAARMVTVRGRHGGSIALAPGVSARTLYEPAPGAVLRPGEPRRARHLELAPGAAWAGPPTDLHREWLVLRGSVRLGDETLGPRDFHVAPAGCPAGPLASDTGASLYLRESDEPATPADTACTVRDAAAGWPEFAPGIRRRVLWQRDGRAALLYLAAPGAQVPMHTHGHDEECLMVQGELFLDDLLLREGDYQLAPAGTGHRLTETDTGAVVYARGDLDLRFVT